MALFEILDLKRTAGSEVVFEDIELQVEEQEIVGIVHQGEPAAGELFQVLTGLLDQDAGEVLFRGEDISRLSPLQRKRQGLTHSFVEEHLFPHLTVADHVIAVSRNSGDTDTELYAQFQQDHSYLRKGLFTLGSVYRMGIIRSGGHQG